MGAATLTGVTLISPAFTKIGLEAVRRFKLHTGLPVKILKCADKDGFATKLQLDRLCGRRPILFFDADWYLLREWHPASTGCFHAVHDPAVFDPQSHPARDCAALGMDRLGYFNSGLMSLNFRNPDHRKLFQLARRYSKQKTLQSKIADPTDQGWLNYAAQRMGLPLARLPLALNFYYAAALWGCVPNIPRQIYAIHAAGVPRRYKARVLQSQAAVFGQPIHPMQTDALRFQHCYEDELR